VGATPGAGLGLSIARSLVVLHGGTLNYEDTPGGGSTFIVLLPVEAS
jgi:signal transduction histidine kinase